jgi:hypothetical protein
MSEEKKEPWLNYLALSTVVLAVCATLATFRGGGYSTRSVMSQSKASNFWAYYQAKSVKGNLYEMSKENLELERKALGERSPLQAAYDKQLAAYAAKVAKYEKEKEEISAQAKAMEAVRDDAQRHGQAFGIAVIFLQIAILLSSIAALLKKKPVFYLSLLVGAAGAFSFVNGFFLFL